MTTPEYDPNAYKVPTPTHETVYDIERGGHYPPPADTESE